MDVFVSTSDKGGTGKSLVSALLFDYVVRSTPPEKHLRVRLSDCDQKVDGQSSLTRLTLSSLACLQNISTNISVDTSKFYDLGKIDGFAQLFADLVSDGSDVVITDTGANMLDGLVAANSFIFNCLRQHEFRDVSLHLLFVLNQTNDCTLAAIKFLEAFYSVTNVYINFVLNSTREDIDDFDLSKNEKFNKAVEEYNKINTHKIKILKYNCVPTIVRQISQFDADYTDVRLPFSLLHEGTGTNPAYRVFLELWLAESDRLFRDMWK